MRDVNRPRKTMKILAGNRFQWIAYDISKKDFMVLVEVPIQLKMVSMLKILNFFLEIQIL